MDIWETNKLILFVIFVIPGFLSMKFYNILHPSVPLDMSKALIDVVAYSCVNYGIWCFPIYLVQDSGLYFEHFNLYLFFYLIVFFISPILLTLFFVWMRSWKWLCRLLPHPTGMAWDYFFGLRKCCWVIVTLKSGTQIAGKYDRNSFASNAPAPEQIYLEEHWQLNSDGGIERPREDTLGILILSKDIEYIEFFKFNFPSDDQ